MICWRRTHGHDLKLRERRYQLVLSRARDPYELRSSDADKHPPAAAGGRGGGPEGHSFGPARVDIIRVVKGADKRGYRMYTEQGDIILGPIGKLTSRKKCTDLITGCDRRCGPLVSTTLWRQCVQAIVRLGENGDAGETSPSAEEAEEFRSLLAAYLTDRGVRDGVRCESNAESYRPFAEHERVYVTLRDLEDWVSVNRGEQKGLQDMPRALRWSKRSPSGPMYA